MQPFSKTTLGKMAACQALGLEYWADHPATGCVWALDADRQPHVVRWYRKTSESCLVGVGEARPPYIAAPRAEWVYPTYDIGDRVRFAA